MKKNFDVIKMDGTMIKKYESKLQNSEHLTKNLLTLRVYLIMFTNSDTRFDAGALTPCS